MANIKVRLGEADRELYERGDEWHDVSSGLVPQMDDVPWDEVDAIEEEYGRPWHAVQQGSAKHLRLLMWSLRRVAGVDEPFPTFKPTPYNYEWHMDGVGDDADPPAQPEGTPPDSAGTSASAKRSSASTRRSPGSTTSRRRKSAS